MINASILTVREMIDVAFGEQNVNQVNFKLMQTVLLILARQLRLLERKVGLIGPDSGESTSNISIREVKLEARLPKSKKKSADKAKDKTKPTTKTEKTTVKSEDKTETDEEDKKGFDNFIETLEQEREQELRIIHQRTDSRNVPDKLPTPMQSLDKNEYVQYEKLLVVERTSSDGTPKKTRRLSIVTQEEFNELSERVKKLQIQFGVSDNLDSMQETSLSDPAAALQLSTRIVETEKTLKQMLEIITELAIEKGIDLSSLTKTKAKKKKTIKERDAEPEEKELRTETYEKPPKADKPPYKSTQAQPLPQPQQQNVPADCINYNDLETAVKDISDKIIKNVTTMASKASSNADNAYKMAMKLENQLTGAFDMIYRIDALENSVSAYTNKINQIDTDLSSQMTNYQELLTQMQHDLELGLETMAEALANMSGDPMAVAELNLNFTHLQMDIDSTQTRQKELQENQSLLSTDLEALLHQIEILRDSKSDRDEVTDALQDKAGIGDLNGLVTRQYFDAVRGDLEKRIAAAYNKFNSQEIVWQKAIDEIHREIDDKADISQVVHLREDVNNNLEMLRSRMQVIKDIVGEPRAAAVTKKLFRDTDCISCTTPAHMVIAESDTIPALPAFKNIKDDDNNKIPKDDGDFTVCYPGKPIPHPTDPRAHFCRRYCGGSHTITTKKSVAGLIVRSMSNKHDTDTQGNVKDKMIPCIPCNVPLKDGTQLFKQGVTSFNVSGDTTVLDFLPKLNSSINIDSSERIDNADESLY